MRKECSFQWGVDFKLAERCQRSAMFEVKALAMGKSLAAAASVFLIKVVLAE